MKKKGIISVASVVVICALGLLLSHVFDWSVDSGNTSGNIAKSSRFSRKTADENVLSNMQELLENDESYKNGVVAGYYVMLTRANQFDALVDISNDVAGDIKDFAEVLKDMNKARPMIDNVCASLATAGKDLNAALGGEKRDNLAQNTINASIAYTTLQKQNRLADRFISVTDAYLKDNEGNDRLKFVRDQWLDYQQMTAALDQDTKAAEELQKKGYKLNPEQTVSALRSFDAETAIKLFVCGEMSSAFEVENSLASGLGGSDLMGAIASITTDGLSNGLTVDESLGWWFNNTSTADGMSLASNDGLAQASNDGLAQASKDGLAQASKDGLAQASKDGLAQVSKDGLAQVSKDGLAQASKDGLQFFNSLTGGSMPNLGLTLDGLFNASSKDGLGHSL
ncbi:MAG: hypothetical protein K6G79_07315, partial [Bacteroidales bacterium]|nr:hypothetical protein [Bacteroidales bacterium]